MLDRLLSTALIGCVSVLAASVLLPRPAIAQKGPAVFWEPITVVGAAKNAQGEPIEGAKIYLASVDIRQRLLAETTTDANGKYRFDKIGLPVEQSDRPGSEDYGVFEVFGSADGYSTTWRGQRWYYPDRRPDMGRGRPSPHTFVGDQPIRQDLVFRLPAKLSGKVVDEDGKPIPRTKIVLFNAQSISIDGYDGPVDGDTYVGSEDFTALYLSRVTPAEMRSRVTDEQGRFSFDNARGRTRYRVYVTPPGFAKKQIYVDTKAPGMMGDASPDATGEELNIVFRKRHLGRIRFVYGDTGKPAKNVFVNVSGDDARQSETTDQKGQIEVRLPTGEYKIGYRTEYGTPYYSRHASEGRIVYQIQEHKNDDPLQIKIERTATLNLTVISDPIGRPLEGVDLWVKGGDYSGSYQWRSWKPPNISSTECPRTDAQGKMRVFLPEGTYRIGAGDQFMPAKHEIDAEGVEVEVKAGETKAITLKLKRRGARDQ